jgi:aminoglycoside 6'-N-acetyltransferase
VPHVAAWWKPATPAEIAAKYLPRLRGETSVRVYAILLDAKPIGMVQAAPLEGAGSADACTIDLLIGDPTLTGAGLGPQIIDAFVTDELFGRLGFTACFADPAEHNWRSVRAFERAGFTRLRSMDTDGQTLSLMARERSSQSLPTVCG